MSDIFAIDDLNPDYQLLKAVALVLKNGGTAAIPTDTVYGLVCDVKDKQAMEKLYSIRKLEFTKQLSIICADWDQIKEYCEIPSHEYFKMMKHTLPGPYTYILPATKQAPKMTLSPRKTIGIRMPDNCIPIIITEVLGNPLITTSVPDLESYGVQDGFAVNKALNGAVDIILDNGGVIPEPSTVIDLSESVPVLIRKGKGSIDFLDLED